VPEWEVCMRTIVFGLMFVLLTSACGGGGDGGPATLDLHLPAEALLDGIVEGGGTVYVDDAFGIAVGHSGPTGWRGFVTFDLGSVPAGITVTSATLSIRQRSVTGTPFATLGGAVVVDHVIVGSTLDAGDYATPSLAQDVGTLSTSTEAGVRTLPVGQQVEADLLAMRPRTSFRLRFPVEFVATGTDYVLFNAQEDDDGSGIKPVLQITSVAP